MPLMRALQLWCSYSLSPPHTVYPKVNIPCANFSFMKERLVGACVVCLSERQCVDVGMCARVHSLPNVNVCCLCVYMRSGSRRGHSSSLTFSKLWNLISGVRFLHTCAKYVCGEVGQQLKRRSQGCLRTRQTHRQEVTHSSKCPTPPCQ